MKKNVRIGLGLALVSAISLAAALPVFADVNNYKELLIDSGYYTEDQLK